MLLPPRCLCKSANDRHENATDEKRNERFTLLPFRHFLTLAAQEILIEQLHKAEIDEQAAIVVSARVLVMKVWTEPGWRDVPAKCVRCPDHLKAGLALEVELSVYYQADGLTQGRCDAEREGHQPWSDTPRAKGGDFRYLWPSAIPSKI